MGQGLGSRGAARGVRLVRGRCRRPVAAPAAATKASDESGKPTLSKDEIRKLEAKCSDEADAKHLHGEPRKAFRNSCKSRGGLKPA